MRYHIETEALAGKYILNKQFGTTRPWRAGSEQAEGQKGRGLEKLRCVPLAPSQKKA